MLILYISCEVYIYDVYIYKYEVYIYEICIYILYIQYIKKGYGWDEKLKHIQYASLFIYLVSALLECSGILSNC